MKSYKNVKVEVIVFAAEDVVRMSGSAVSDDSWITEDNYDWLDFIK